MIGEFTLGELARSLKIEGPARDVVFIALSTDTRSLQPGDVYLALAGKSFDGHDFAEQAVKQGAAAVIVSRHVTDAVPQLLVPDTHAALAALARLNRRRSRARLCALTGSQGKTTVKEMTAAILRHAGRTLATRENLNNTIGVPLTLLQLAESDQFAVIEMGADKKGEIAFSVGAAEPDMALITGASPAHIEGFGSLQGIVIGKGEILDALSANGVALLNADDAAVLQWVERARKRTEQVRLFSLRSAQEADYYAGDIVMNADGSVSFQLCSPAGKCAVTSRLLGLHNVRNAVAAAALALETGAGLEHVQRGLAEVEAVPGRLAPRPGRAGSLILDDSYNAGPESYKAAIDVLLSLPGEPLLLAGDMLELGADSEAAHREVGEYARQSGLKRLLATGPLCELMVDAFNAGGNEDQRPGMHYQDSAKLIQDAQQYLGAEAVILVKGSRGSRMDLVVNELIETGDT